ncbi:hypothetical protein LOAG_01920 [Loa loa]|uniref:Uncharacterized protein n=1 Tax=Loa loa TaxID=7209 RepID=A0A1S0U9U0_LOALO|nr:hypothetical protein LOAG_01920 [Loa loa]EFO26561.1 hypothetical protein LOAG_01920 [Loa loa]
METISNYNAILRKKSSRNSANHTDFHKSKVPATNDKQLELPEEDTHALVQKARKSKQKEFEDITHFSDEFKLKTRIYIMAVDPYKQGVLLEQLMSPEKSPVRAHSCRTLSCTGLLGKAHDKGEEVSSAVASFIIAIVVREGGRGGEGMENDGFKQRDRSTKDHNDAVLRCRGSQRSTYEPSSFDELHLGLFRCFTQL